MRYVDLAVIVAFILSLVIIYFFWGCHLDLYVTILAGIIIATTALVHHSQYKKLKELQTSEQEN